MKSKILTIALVGISLMAFGQKKPTISFESTTQDLGKIPQNVEQKCKFTFSNTGNDSLKILKVTPDNGCVIDFYTKTAIPPQGKGQIKLVLNGISALGPFSKKVIVTTNDPLHQTVTLTIKGEIIPKTSPSNNKTNTNNNKN
jgi:hypothetical protein